MEIKSTKFLILSLFFSSLMYGSDDLITLKSFYEINEKQITNSRNINNKNPLQGVVLDFSKVVNRSSELVITEYTVDSFDLDNSKLNQNDNYELYLKPDEYIQIIDKGSIELLSNGSFFVKFLEIPNLKDFATLHQLTFVRDLSDINIGVFKVKNMYELELKLEALKEDENIISLDLDTIDPSLTTK